MDFTRVSESVHAATSPGSLRPAHHR
jgi:hypothetical protein